MTLQPDVVSAIAVVAVVLAVVLTVAVVLLAVRLRRLASTYEAAIGDGGADDLVAALAEQRASLASLREDVGVVHANTETLRDLHRGAVSKVGLVRYDAFPDMGGMLSFSAALLDERGDGVVISAINGRQETRAYGKPVQHGSSDHTLSDEEQQAVDAALDDAKRRPLATPGGKRRRRG